MGDEGFEQDAESSGKTRSSQTGDAEFDAVLSDSVSRDPDLAVVIGAWPTLLRAVRQSIAKLTKGSGKAAKGVEP
jgi:hypothetical protein